jgi:DNA-binding NtrC family response regulator
MSAGLSDLPAETTPPRTVSPIPQSVLIVDDEPAIRVLLERYCMLNGLQPVLAASGAEAVEIYRREGEKIGVVLLDVRMPGMSGPATLEVLRRLNPQVRCCFMSGDLGDYTAEELRQQGALHLFNKPLPLRELIAALQAIVASPSAPS